MTIAAAEAGGTGTVRPPLPPHTVLQYRLSPADALEWERRDPSERKRKRGLMAAALLGGIMLLSVTARHLPDWLSQLHSTSLAFVILLLPVGLALLIQRHDMLRRARIAIPAEVGVRLEVWDRRLVETRENRAQPLVIGAEALRDMVETADHLFLYSKNGTIIIPVSAFADARARDAFAAHWEAMAG